MAEADERVASLMETKARGLIRARREVPEDALCAERAHAALGEAAAILADAARNCRDLPRVMPLREAYL